MIKQVSLQQNVIKNAIYSSVLAGILAWILMLMIAILHAMQLHDEFMHEISDSLLESQQVTNFTQINEMSDEFDIEYQLFKQNKLISQSQEQDFITQVSLLKNEHGLSYGFIHGQPVRILIEQEHDLSLIAVQPIIIRFSELGQSAIAFAGLLILLWLVQWLILRFSIRRQLQPLNNLSKIISEKSAQDLTPVQLTNFEIVELKPIVEQLNFMLARVEQSLLAEQRFTADASHELRSPLSAIQMRLQVLKRKYQEDENLNQALQSIQNDVNRGTKVLENLLLMARLDPQKVENLPKSSVNLTQLLDEILQSAQAVLHEKQFVLQTHFTTAFLVANQDLLFICLRNLIENAIKYTPQAGQIQLEMTQNTNQIQLIIENSGNLTPDILEHLGQRFYRKLGTKTQGSGLGLSICKKIVELHQGEISFELSKLGGLKIIIYFKIQA